MQSVISPPGDTLRYAQTVAYIKKLDYQGFEFAPGTYGTVIAHMAFSSQLWYLREQGSPRLNRYERKYEQMLLSLKTGGCFVGIQGLPFMEKALLDGYDVHRSWVMEVNERFYTARIHR